MELLAFCPMCFIFTESSPLQAVGLETTDATQKAPFCPSDAVLCSVAGAAVHAQLADPDALLARGAISHADHLCFLASRRCRHSTYKIMVSRQLCMVRWYPSSQLDRNCTKSEGMDAQCGLAGAALGCFVRLDCLGSTSDLYSCPTWAALSCIWRQLQKLSQRGRVGRGELITFKELSPQPVIVVRARWSVIHQLELLLHPAGKVLGQQIAPVRYGLLATFAGGCTSQPPSQAPATALFAVRL